MIILSDAYTKSNYFILTIKSTRYVLSSTIKLHSTYSLNTLYSYIWKSNMNTWLCFSKWKITSLSTFLVVKCLIMCYSISLTPSKFCSNKQKLFRMHTTRKQRYPASQLLTWDLRMPANLRCMTRLQRHPTWDPLFLRTSRMGFSTRL